MSKISGQMKIRSSDKKNKWSRCLDKHQTYASTFKELMDYLDVKIINQMAKYNPS